MLEDLLSQAGVYIAAWVVGRQVVEVYADGAAHDPLFARHRDIDAACGQLRRKAGAEDLVSIGMTKPESPNEFRMKKPE